MNTTSFFKSYWPSLLTLSVVLYATLWPDPELPDDLPLIPNIDKLIHAIMMGGLYGAIVFDTMRRLRREGSEMSLSRKFRLLLAFSIMAFGALDEFLQASLTETRSAEFLDLLADWTGTWVAFFSAPPAVKAVLRKK